MRRRVASAAAATLGILVAAFPSAGTVLERGRASVDYRTWTLEVDSLETKVSQLRAPITAQVGVGRALLVLATAGASSSLEPDGGASASLQGPADATLQILLPFAGDRLLLQGGVNLPSGRRELDAEELAVAQALGHPVLGFGLKEYGRGLDWSGGLAVALAPAPGVALGAGGGVILHGPYTLVERSEDFEPGDEWSASGGLDLGGVAGAAAPLRVDAVYRSFGEDRFGSRRVFQEGNQVQVETIARAGADGVRADLLARVVLQADHTAYGAEEPQVEGLKTAAGTQVLLVGGADLPVSGRLRIGLDGEWIRFTGTEGGRSDGTAFGAGPSAFLSLGARGSLSLRGRILRGTLDDDGAGGSVDLRGYQVAAGLSLRDL